MSKFLFGAVYIIEQDYRDEEIKRDLRAMKEHGFNLVTLWPVNNPWLAKTSHEWIFDKTRFVLDQCDLLGMKAILQLFGQNQAQEFMPDSALTPEMESMDQYGPWINSDCMWANLNHPTVREYFDRYFKEAIMALKDHPAVYGWDVFNEAHFRSDDEWTVRNYQEWLKEKYGTIGRLNKEWYRRYEGFSQVRPDRRRAPYSIWSSLLPSIDYEKFRSDNVTEICRFLYETALKYDSSHPIIIDGTSGAILYEDITLRNNDEFATAHVPDIYGGTFYPKSWGRNYKDTPWKLSMYLSIPAAAARKAGKPYFVNELQTHTQSVLTPGSEVGSQELVNWTLMCIFTGAAGMQLWRWRPFLHGYQAAGRGLTRMDGTPNERAEAIGAMLRGIHANGELFEDFQIEKPVVQIACSYDVRLFFDSLLKFGVERKSFWAENTEGWYKLFWNWGMPAEFVDLGSINEENQKIPVMVLPGAVRLSREEILGLRRYVEQGGILIADGRMGALNEWACVPPEGIPGRLLSELLGVAEVDVESGTYMEIDGVRIPTGFQSQKLEITDPNAQVVACMEDGSPAVVRHRFGKGETLYFNSFLGLVLSEKMWMPIRKLVAERLSKVSGIRAEKEEKVHLSYICCKDKKGILAVNFSESPSVAELTGLPPKRHLKEIFTGSQLETSERTSLYLPGNSSGVYLYDA